MKIQRVHILSSILAFVFSGAVMFFTSQNQKYLNVDESEVKLPEVFEQSTGQVELAFKAEPNSVKAGEQSTIKLNLVNKGTASIKDVIYKIKIPDQFTIDEDSIDLFTFFGVFLDGVEVNDNEILVYMVNYPKVDINSALPNGTELISFDVVAKDATATLDYTIGFNSSFDNQFLDLTKVNVLGKVTNATLSVIDSSVIVIDQPVLTIYTPTTYGERYKFEGTKQAGTGIKINGQITFSESDAVTWEANMPLTNLGKNEFEFQTFKSSNESTVVKAEIFKHGISDIRVDADSNGNSVVDARDLAVFAGSFYKYRNDPDGKIEDTDPSGYRLSDMNKIVSGTTAVYGDGKIDAKDTSEFVKNWKKSYTTRK